MLPINMHFTSYTSLHPLIWHPPYICPPIYYIKLIAVDAIVSLVGKPNNNNSKAFLIYSLLYSSKLLELLEKWLPRKVINGIVFLFNVGIQYAFIYLQICVIANCHWKPDCFSCFPSIQQRP